MKKRLMTLTASALLVSAYAATPADAATYKVQKGDSLWKIAQKYDTSVDQLRSINKLSNAYIFPNQILKVDQVSTAPTVKPAQVTQTTTAKTYKVKSGDSLSKIAANHKISLTNLMEWNKLSTTLIYPGDVLTVTKAAASTTTKRPTAATTKPAVTAKPATNKTEAAPTTTSSYKVKNGDSLWKISSNLGVSITDLKKWNSLSSDLIQIGQVLQVKASVTEKPVENVTDDITKLVNEATKLLGTPYLFGGSSIDTGFDCSGFVHYVFNKAGKSIGRYSSDGYYNRSFYVTNPEVGDLVFFENTYRKGISHLGIFIGNNSFIHAANGGVQITSLDNSYWKKHFEGFKRFY
ncbi:C40 family peptidase [Aquibacillus rhizosphaerae]|uniref:LysM peptidoglycan-binding domain-containing protein n=1 Tax=Aquibacillus rhizosphaerae TaxID=3051431 RepID=A0ABT7KZH8_9BACI|nr:peptidoglycan endopeptidase [Aquibacillus sp. LR5S19]MDL4838932.1 LysM peptidoglycan-binding domain-containing protein [Aquibacillus sp. LR5S19]